MATIFSDATITRFTQQGEDEFARDFNLILDRISLPIVSGISTYTLPDYVFSINRITYKGFKLDPLTHRDAREIFQSATQQSKPFWYIFNNIGQNQIKLFPVPTENLAAGVINLYGIDIPTCFIIQFYRKPDYSTFVIPDYLRRRLLKAYVMKMCFTIEGRGQNLKAAKYWSDKWEFLKQNSINLLNDLHGKPRKLIASESANYGFNKPFPAPPILPVDRYGIGVDPGE